MLAGGEDSQSQFKRDVHLLPYHGLGTGIPRATSAWANIDLNDERPMNQFRAVVQRPAEEAALGQWVGAELESRLESQLAAKVVLQLRAGSVGKSELAKGLGHATVSGELHKQVRRLLDLGLVEMTLPDKPNSRLQRYRLTESGQHLFRQDDR